MNIEGYKELEERTNAKNKNDDSLVSMDMNLTSFSTFVLGLTQKVMNLTYVLNQCYKQSNCDATLEIVILIYV